MISADLASFWVCSLFCPSHAAQLSCCSTKMMTTTCLWWMTSDQITSLSTGINSNLSVVCTSHIFAVYTDKHPMCVPFKGDKNHKLETKKRRHEDT